MSQSTQETPEVEFDPNDDTQSISDEDSVKIIEEIRRNPIIDLCEDSGADSVEWWSQQISSADEDFDVEHRLFIDDDDDEDFSTDLFPLTSTPIPPETTRLSQALQEEIDELGWPIPLANHHRNISSAGYSLMDFIEEIAELHGELRRLCGLSADSFVVVDSNTDKAKTSQAELRHLLGILSVREVDTQEDWHRCKQEVELLEKMSNLVDEKIKLNQMKMGEYFSKTLLNGKRIRLDSTSVSSQIESVSAESDSDDQSAEEDSDNDTATQSSRSMSDSEAPETGQEELLSPRTSAWMQLHWKS